MTHQQRVALARIMEDLIKSDDIIDMSEMEFFFRMRERYNIKTEHMVEAKKTDFGAAVGALRSLTLTEQKELMRELQGLLSTHGGCAPEEALIVMALDYSLDPNSTRHCQLVTTSVSDISIDKFNIVYTETEYDNDINDYLSKAWRCVEDRFALAGLKFVYIPHIADDFRHMPDDSFRKTIEFLAPSVHEDKRGELFHTLRNLTTTDFCNDFLVKKMGLGALFDTEPAVLFQVCRSNDKVVYLHLTLGADLLADFDSIIDKFETFATHTPMPIRRIRRGSARFIYQGFHKALFDIMAFPGQKVESRIVVDTHKRRIMFPDLGTNLTVPTAQLALYAFILQQSICSPSHELPIEPPSPVVRKKLEATFAHIYGMMSDNPNGDYTKSLTPNLSHLKKAITSIDLLDNADMYLPERKDGILRIKLNPAKVFVIDNGQTVEMARSTVWKKM